MDLAGVLHEPVMPDEVPRPGEESHALHRVDSRIGVDPPRQRPRDADVGIDVEGPVISYRNGRAAASGQIRSATGSTEM